MELEKGGRLLDKKNLLPLNRLRISTSNLKILNFQIMIGITVTENGTDETGERRMAPPAKGFRNTFPDAKESNRYGRDHREPTGVLLWRSSNEPITI